MKLRSKKNKKRPIRKNVRFSVILLLIPILGGAVIIWYTFFSDHYNEFLGKLGASRLTTEGWEIADKAFKGQLPEYERKFAYYRVKEQQTLASLSEHFGVPASKLADMNPGQIVSGTTIKVPPIEQPFTPLTATSGNIGQAKVFYEENIIHVKNDFKLPRINTTIPELAAYLAPHGAIIQVEPGVWKIEKPINIEENIRIDITGDTVKKLMLRSEPNQNITCLCLENADALIKDVSITTYDPKTDQPDTNYADGRSFIRALKSSRMDMIDSDISYLGNELQAEDPTKKPLIQRNGGTYGISWRIPDGTLGSDIATGWVENNRFHHNYYGSYTFGTSGMIWRHNVYVENDLYGLDPHDDSNNAMIEFNTFERNGKHGFIVSKRCNYNVIRNNVSRDNKLHGYMLHQDSVYNVIENNVAENNVDNFAIYQSDYNTIRNNTSINAKNSHVRVNEKSVNNFITNNSFTGTGRGIYIYGNSRNTYISGNTFVTKREALVSDKAQTTVFANNTVNGLHYKITAGDRIIFGPNTVKIEQNN